MIHRDYLVLSLTYCLTNVIIPESSKDSGIIIPAKITGTLVTHTIINLFV